jgi:hypothetical protein
MFLANPGRRIVGGMLTGLFLLGYDPAFSAESRIELTDGSVIAGELIGVEQGRYRIHSATLGEVSVPESNIRSIRPMTAESEVNAPAAASDNKGYGAELASIQQQLTTNPGVMQQIMALQNDPEIKSALADPDFTRMVLAGDLEKLRSDSRFQRLLEHPALQAIMGQVAQ